MPKKVNRYLEVFDQKTDKLIFQIRIEGLRVAELREIFGAEKHNRMGDCWEIKVKQAPYFLKKYGAAFDFKNYAYFLSEYDE